MLTFSESVSASGDPSGSVHSRPGSLNILQAGPPKAEKIFFTSFTQDTGCFQRKGDVCAGVRPVTAQGYAVCHWEIL